MIQCRKNWTLFPKLQLSITKNSVLSLSKYSTPKSAFRVDLDMIKCFLGRLKLYNYYVIVISKKVGDTHRKGLLVTNLV